MGRLIVIEGVDGSGKQTLVKRLCGHWRQGGRRVATMAFPRYGVDVHADLVREALYGRLGDLSESVYGPAVLFALDRRAAAEQIRELLRRHDIVLLDRYVTSNAAYGSARLGGPDQPTDFADWVRRLEIERFGIPVPGLQVLLDTPTELAAARARGRAHDNAEHALDTFERDADLQRRTGAMYAALARQGYLSPWTVLTPAPHDGQVSIDGLLEQAAGPDPVH